MSKPNRKGRDQSAHFIKHDMWLLKTDAWKSLSCTARALEIVFKELYNGRNNGDLYLSVRQAADRLGVAANTARKALAELKEKGFIKIAQAGSFTWKGSHATSWILTEFEYAGNLPTKDFANWKAPYGK